MTMPGNASFSQKAIRLFAATGVCSMVIGGWVTLHPEPAGAAPKADVAATCGSVGPFQACVSAWTSGITVAFSTSSGSPDSSGYAVVDMNRLAYPTSSVAYQSPVFWGHAGTLYVPLPAGLYSIGVTVLYGANQTTNNAVLTEETTDAPGSVPPPTTCSTVTTGEFQSPTVPSSGPIAAGVAATQVNGCSGYWIASPDGQVANVGGAPDLGPLTGFPLNAPISDIAATPDSEGYYLLGSDGGIFTFGDARFYGSTGAIRLNQPVVGMAATPDGKGYWLVAKDGGVFSFGDAHFYGSTSAIRLNQPVVGMAATPDGGGYWLVAADGGVFSFGDARFHGSMGGVRLNKPVVGITSDPQGNGYRMVASDGGIFSFGAPFYGSLGAHPPQTPIEAMSASVDGNGYYMLGQGGAVYAFGDAPFLGLPGDIY